jgi:multiple sugar transport system permease protein
MPRLSSAKIITILFLLPAAIFLLITGIIPILYALGLSFFRYKINLPDLPIAFIGFGNYIRMFTDRVFIQSVINTAVFAVFSVSLEMVGGIIIAMMASGDSRPLRVFCSVLTIPMIMAPVAAGTMWRMMLDSSTGVLNYFISLVGLPRIPWLAQPVSAFVSVTMVNAWQLIPWVTIIVISGLKNVPTDTIHAALIDGASPFRIFTRVIFPEIKSLLVVVLLMRFIDAFKVFDTIYVMTNGGPGIATEMLPNYIFQQALNYFDAGYSSAIAIMFIIIMTFLCLLFTKAGKVNRG